MPKCTPVEDENFARLVWAAHILSYMTISRSQSPLFDNLEKLELDGDGSQCEGQELDDDGISDINTLLGPDNTSIKEKFLDCLTETVSYSKGWDHVTATGLRELEDCIKVDLVKNAGFDGIHTSDQYPESQYLGELMSFMQKQCGCEEDLLAARAQFEHETIRYCQPRLRNALSSLKQYLLSNHKLKYMKRASQQILPEIVDFLQNVSEVGDYTEDSLRVLAGQAYEIACYFEQDHFSQSYGECIDSKLHRLIRITARPISAVRAFETVAREFTRFQNLEICVHQTPAVVLDQRFHVSIYRAWELLGLGSYTDQVAKILKKHEKKFDKSCQIMHSVHTEVQLLNLYLTNPETRPTINYLGSSKKSCLLCETILQISPLKLRTRGRHGKCYPRWGIPVTLMDSLKPQCEEIVKLLVKRIQDCQVRLPSLFEQAVAESSARSQVNSLDLLDFTFRRSHITDEERKRDDLHDRRRLQSGSDSKSVRVPRFPSSVVEVQTSCLMCGNGPASLCASCESSRYCSKRCQKADWHSHKLLCRSYSKIKSSPPSKQHRLAILLPQDEIRPRLGWVLCERRSDEDGVWEHRRVAALLGTDNPILSSHLIPKNVRRDHDLEDSVEVVWRDMFLFDGSRSNQSLSRAITPFETTTHAWRGPILIMKRCGIEPSSSFYQDVTLSDFRHALDYFVDYRTETTQPLDGPNPSRYGSEDILGVRVACDGNQKLHAVEQFTQESIPRTHPIRCQEGQISPISRLVELPVQGWFSEKDRRWHYLTDEGYGTTAESNSTACKLFTETDPRSESWGWGPMEWQSGVGDLLLVRADGLDLSVEDAKVLCLFCEEILLPMFEDGLGVGLVQRTREEVVNYITRENMEKFRLKLNAREQ